MKFIPFWGSYLTPAHLKAQIRAIEPSTDVGYEYDIELESDNSPPTSSDKKKRKFVPIHESQKKKSKLSQGVDEMKKDLGDIKDIISNDPTKELVEIIKEDSARQAVRDEQFMRTMMMMVMNSQTPTQQNFDQNLFQTQNQWPSFHCQNTGNMSYDYSDSQSVSSGSSNF